MNGLLWAPPAKRIVRPKRRRPFDRRPICPQCGAGTGTCGCCEIEEQPLQSSGSSQAAIVQPLLSSSSSRPRTYKPCTSVWGCGVGDPGPVTCSQVPILDYVYVTTTVAGPALTSPNAVIACCANWLNGHTFVCPRVAGSDTFYRKCDYHGCGATNADCHYYQMEVDLCSLLFSGYHWMITGRIPSPPCGSVCGCLPTGTCFGLGATNCSFSARSCDPFYMVVTLWTSGTVPPRNEITFTFSE